MNTYRRFYAQVLATPSGTSSYCLATIRDGVIRAHKLDASNGFGHHDGTWEHIALLDCRPHVYNSRFLAVHLTGDTPSVAARDLGLALMALPQDVLDDLQRGNLALCATVYNMTVSVMLARWVPAGIPA